MKDVFYRLLEVLHWVGFVGFSLGGIGLSIYVYDVQFNFSRLSDDIWWIVLVYVGHRDGHPVYPSYPKVDTVEETNLPKNQREIELLQRENDKLNERFDRIMLVNEQLVKQHENEQILRREMQAQLTGLTAQLGQLKSDIPLLEDKSRLQEEHKSLKGAVMDLIKHISTKNQP